MRDERTTDYYTVLEILPAATENEIKKAWHEQLQVWHPDRFHHSPTLHEKAEARTRLINQAYQILSDPVARARYDVTAQPSTSRQATPTPLPCIRPIVGIIRLHSTTRSTDHTIPPRPSRATVTHHALPARPAQDHGAGHYDPRRQPRASPIRV